LTSLLKTAKIIQAMNQVEGHQKVNQKELLDYCSKRGIHLTASPLAAGTLITDPTIVEIGKKHNKSAAQVMIRWQIQRGVIAIPKSTKKERIKENIEVFDFSLTDEEMKTLKNMK
jgi:diketogulonate reductase-like aldo/keto reductase